MLPRVFFVGHTWGARASASRAIPSMRMRFGMVVAQYLACSFSLSPWTCLVVFELIGVSGPLFACICASAPLCVYVPVYLSVYVRMRRIHPGRHLAQHFVSFACAGLRRIRILSSALCAQPHACERKAPGTSDTVRAQERNIHLRWPTIVGRMGSHPSPTPSAARCARA